MTEVEPRPRVPRSRLAALRVAELRDLAASLGIGRTTAMRKGALVDAINERYDTADIDTDTDTAEQEAGAEATVDRSDEQQGGEDSLPVPDEPGAPDAPEPQPAAPEEPAPAQPTEEPAATAGEPAGTGVAVTASEDAVDEAEGGESPQDDAAELLAPTVVDEPDEAARVTAEQPAAERHEGEQPGSEQPAPSEPESAAVSPDEAAGGAEVGDAAAEQRGSGAPKAAAQHVNAGLTGIAEDLQELQRQGGADGEEGEGERQVGRRGRGRGRGRQNQQQNGAQQSTGQQNGGQQNAAPANGAQQGGAQQDQGAQRGQQQKDQQQPQQQQPKAEPQEQREQQRGGDQQQDGEGRRGRYRDRKRRGAGGEWDEPEVRDDDVLIPIAGILDVLDNYAFVRTSGYLSGANDVYVSLGQVKKYHLRRGDAVVGSIRQVPEQEQPSRQKYNALVKVDSINGLPVGEAESRVEFEQLTPLFPQERLRLETDPQKISTRVVDLVAPVGKGQRGLIVAPPRSGRTLLLQAIANAITRNNPEAHLMVVLVDERPEEVTEMQRTVKGEVIASTFDRAAEDHTTVAELAIDRAKRLVELGYDVVVLLDSITRLARAYAQTVPAAGRQIGGGLDAAALLPAKQLFGAARNVENGGSLTVIAAALTETGEADAVVLSELRGAANSELVLSSVLADKRIFPAIDVSASGTVRDEQLLGPDEVKVTRQLRRALAGREPQESLETVVSKLRDTQSNVEFLVQMQKTLPSGK